MANKPKDKTDWNLATWEGARRETLRRWAELPLERIIAALEEMQELNDALHCSTDHATKAQNASSVQGRRGDYERGSDDENFDK
ncbi:MAG: hypothetical protein COB30_006020 [Ectothiorhodospiraceae bacterium]|nr:hypothetical protein [Ectothiorhodospiraceae bacterium]